MVGVPQLNGKQKIYSGLVLLASEPGEIEERLEAAYRKALASLDAQLELPPHFAAEFTRIQKALETEFFGASGGPARRRRRWACDMASRIVAFYDKLARFR